MNLFKGLLFLHGHISHPTVLDDDFAPTYGNKRASERSFRDAFAELEFARREAQPEPCSSAGCG